MQTYISMPEAIATALFMMLFVFLVLVFLFVIVKFADSITAGISANLEKKKQAAAGKAGK